MTPDLYTSANVNLRLLDPLGASRFALHDLALSHAPDDYAFRATVVFDGVTFTASNRGDGGANRYSGNPRAVAAAHAFAAEILPGHEPLDALVRDHIHKREIRSMLERSVRDGICFVLPEDAREEQDGFRCVRGTDAAARAYVARHYPGAIVLNDLLSEAA